MRHYRAWDEHRHCRTDQSRGNEKAYVRKIESYAASARRIQTSMAVDPNWGATQTYLYSKWWFCQIIRSCTVHSLNAAVSRAQMIGCLFSLMARCQVNAARIWSQTANALVKTKAAWLRLDAKRKLSSISTVKYLSLVALGSYSQYFRLIFVYRDNVDFERHWILSLLSSGRLFGILVHPLQGILMNLFPIVKDDLSSQRFCTRKYFLYFNDYRQVNF